MSDRTAQDIFSKVIEAIAVENPCAVCGGIHQGRLLRLIARMSEDYDFINVELSPEADEVFGAALLQKD